MVIRNATRVSARGAQFIASFEGGQGRDGLFRPYWDRPGGTWTIGYGHTAGVTRHSKPLTKKQAVALLRRDLDRKYGAAVAALLRRLKIRVSQKQFDALVSIAYNVGPGILDSGRSLGDRLRAYGRLRSAARRANVAEAMQLYDHAGGVKLAGLTRRRKAEAALWMGGRYA